MSQLVLHSIFYVSFVIVFAIGGNQPHITEISDSYSPEKLTFEKDIKPIMNTYCGGLFCHHGKPSSFTTYKVVHHYIKNGEFEKRVLIEKTMPKRKKLPKETYNILKKWIKEGALEK